jgi:hypothetical protein
MGKILVPVEVELPVFDTPDGRDFWSDPSMDRPRFQTAQAARTFFGRTGRWLLQVPGEDGYQLDGVPIVIDRTPGGRRSWTLYDVERVAHGLTQKGRMQVAHLQRVIAQVKLLAENYKYLPQSELGALVTPQSAEVYRKARMATQLMSLVSDDMDGSAGARTRHFAIENVRYKIDLTDVNWEAFLTAVGPFMLKASPDKRRRLASSDEIRERAEIRAWAQQNGRAVGARGRIPLEVVESYRQAHESAGKHAQPE